jgi:hypothetical protein
MIFENYGCFLGVPLSGRASRSYLSLVTRSPPFGLVSCTRSRISANIPHALRSAASPCCGCGVRFRLPPQDARTTRSAPQPHSMQLSPLLGLRLTIPSAAFRSPRWSASSFLVSQPALPTLPPPSPLRGRHIASQRCDLCRLVRHFPPGIHPLPSVGFHALRSAPSSSPVSASLSGCAAAVCSAYRSTAWFALPLIFATTLPHSMQLSPLLGYRLPIPSAAFRSPHWSASSFLVSQPVCRSASRAGLFTLLDVGFTRALAFTRASPLPPNVGAGRTGMKEAILHNTPYGSTANFSSLNRSVGRRPIRGII